MENIKFLTIESDTFEELRRNFNEQLQKLLKTMIDKNLSEGKMSVNIDVSLLGEYIPNYDPHVDGETRKVLRPSFTYKTTKQVTMKDDITGKYNSEMEVVWDDELKQYVERFVSNTSQRTIFDAEYREMMGDDDSEVVVEDNEVKCLEGKMVYALPDNSNDDESKNDDSDSDELGEEIPSSNDTEGDE